MVSTSRLRAPAGLQIDLYVDWDATAFFLSIQHNQKRLIFASTVRESDKTGRRLNHGITAFFLSRRLHAQPRETEREKSTVVLFRCRFCCRVLLPSTLFGRYQLYMRSRRIVNHARSQ